MNSSIRTTMGSSIIASTVNSPLCTDPKHLPKSLWFCKSHAAGEKTDLTMYCEQCHPEFKDKHKVCSKQSMALPPFEATYKTFKDKLKLPTQSNFIQLYKKAHPERSNLQYKKAYQQAASQTGFDFKNALVEAKAYDWKLEFESEKYRKWLLQRKFWEPNSWNNITVKKDMDDFIKDALKGDGSSKPNPWLFEMKIRGSREAGGGAVEYSSEIKLLESRVIELGREKQLGELFTRLTSYYKDGDIERGLKQIERLQGEDSSGSSENFLFDLAKLKSAELHSQGSEMLKSFLSESGFPQAGKREQELFHYFSAISEWQVVEDPDDEPADTKIFLQTRNKLHYRLGDPAKYIHFLSEAINIQARPLYYACRAMGYMVQDNYAKAEKDYQEADCLHFKNDALLNNRNFNHVQDQNILDCSLLLESLSQRSTEFIINFCSYLKKTKDYRQLQLCCEELVSREPGNLAFRIRRFDTFFKLGDKDNAKEELAIIKNLDELDEDEITECERKIELLKARENENFGNVLDSEENYKRVAEMGETSATHWYNYAAFIFNCREELEQNDRALKAINKAIEIQEKPHYYELKYLLLFTSGNMEEAKTIHAKLTDAEDKFRIMKEHVNENT